MKIKIFVKDESENNSPALRGLLEEIQLDSDEDQVTYHDISETELPLENVVFQEIGQGITLYYQFDEEPNEENNSSKLLEFASSHKNRIVSKLETNEHFQPRLKSNLETVYNAVREEATPIFATIKKEVAPALGGVWNSVTAYVRGGQYQPTMFSAEQRKNYFNKQSRNELIAGVTLGLLCIPVALFLPTAVTAILAVAAIALIGAAIYHKTKANQVENLEKYEPVPQM
ncbi:MULTISPECIES: hypothetical protein [Legionella]|uniref:Uncharacterized protein n=1 Tax=Legionella maceachernii TaxID=466 RepID=A0A0W0WBT8_9GAMM|nr:hypothetical protein [Legionella maceachernii]KTD29818.1 hypothetical protein Lmac_0762 [Legionella maceachernii]SJZ78773.1 hypothetical protein SAMN02745128_01070 [Legionella maceachernii]SUP02952.1 Uncharacterised protein [Legionella maceachernii]